VPPSPAAAGRVPRQSITLPRHVTTLPRQRARLSGRGRPVPRESSTLPRQFKTLPRHVKMMPRQHARHLLPLVPAEPLIEKRCAHRTKRALGD